MSFYGNIIKHLQNIFASFHFVSPNYTTTFTADNGDDYLTIKTEENSGLSFANANQKNTIIIQHDRPNQSQNNDCTILNINNDGDISKENTSVELFSPTYDNLGHNNGKTVKHNINLNINNEISERQSQDLQLSKKIDAEITNRTEADQLLQTNIETEKSERQSADKKLQSNIDSEVSDRGNADSALQQNIDNEAAARDASDKTLQQNINTEASTRDNKDKELQKNINTEKTAREEADTNHNNRISNLEKQIDGLTGAMHFIGAGETLPSTGQDGDVYAITAGTNKGKEYVWNNGSWIELGDTTQEQKDITNLKNRADLTEQKLNTIQGSGEGSIAQSLTDAKAYTDALANGQVATNTEAINNINNINSGILAQSKKYTDTLANGQVNTNKINIEKINNTDTGILAQAKEYTDTLANGQVSTNTKNILINTNALKEAAFFKGVLSQLPTDLSSYKDGNIIAVNGAEYIFYNNKWNIFGGSEAENIAELEKKVGQNTTDINSLEKKVEQNTQTINDLNSKTIENTKALNTLDTKVNENSQTINSLAITGTIISGNILSIQLNK